MIRRQTILSSIWLAAFAVAVLLVEALVWMRNGEGYKYILPQQRVEHMLPMIQIYASILTGVLAFWFIKPFRTSRNDAANRARFKLALVCTLLFNIVIIAILGGMYLHEHAATTALETIKSARTISIALGFLVAPINFYYFGMKKSE